MCRESGTHGLEEGSWKSVLDERNNSLAAHPTSVTTPEQAAELVDMLKTKTVNAWRHVYFTGT